MMQPVRKSGASTAEKHDGARHFLGLGDAVQWTLGADLVTVRTGKTRRGQIGLHETRRHSEIRTRRGVPAPVPGIAPWR